MSGLTPDSFSLSRALNSVLHRVSLENLLTTTRRPPSRRPTQTEFLGVAETRYSTSTSFEPAAAATLIDPDSLARNPQGPSPSGCALSWKKKHLEYTARSTETVTFMGS